MNIIFAGTPAFSVPVLRALLLSEHSVIAVYTQPDKAVGRGQHVQMNPVKQLALEHQIPVYQPSSLKKENEQEILAALKPDLMIVVAYGLILPAAVLAIPPLGCINVHASLLPRWRGASPIQQAILQGDSETGISIMKMEAGLDTGPVYAQALCPINLTDTSQTLHDRLSLLGAETLLKELPYLASRVPQPQNEEEACYAGKITKKEGLIDWTKTAWEIFCQVRAFNPWPIAYFYINGQYVRVWEGEVVSEHGKKNFFEITSHTVPPLKIRPVTGKVLSDSVVPGTLLKASADGIEVAAGGRSIFRIKRCQLANGKVLAVKDCLNAARALFLEGTCLNEP